MLVSPLHSSILQVQAHVAISQRCSQTCLNIWNNLESLLFPEQEIVQEDPHKILAQWQLDEAVSNNEENLTSALSSLTHFLELWAKQLEGDKALATPITSSSKFQETLPTETSTNATENASAIHLSLKLIFRPPKRYLSYKEQKSMEKGVLPDRKGAKVDAWSPGGVELVIIESEPRRLELVAKRCNIDGDTIIKFTSERAIVRRLEETIRIWKKVRAMPIR